MLGFPLPVRLRKSRRGTRGRDGVRAPPNQSGPLVSAATSDREPAGGFGCSRVVMRPPPGRWMLAMCLAVCSIGSRALIDSTDTGRWRVGALWSADDHDASEQPHPSWPIARL
jgi:hypothetical protein